MSLKPLVTAVAALVLSATAHAASSVTANLSDFTMTVDQGTFSWTPGTSATFAVYGASSDKPFFEPSLIDQVGTWGDIFGTGSVTTSLTTAIGSASATATSLSALATTVNGGSAYAIAQWNGLFDLGDNSKITFSWKESSTGSNNGAIGSFGYTIVGFGDGYAAVQHYYPENSGNWSTLDHGVTYSFWTNGDTHYASLASTEAVSNLNFHARVEVATNDVAAVPEPASMALVFGGLGVVGFLARRRRPQA